MHEMIADLVQTCPQLRALDRVNKQNVLDPYSEISISRDDGNVDYSVKPLRRYVYSITSLKYETYDEQGFL